MKYQYFTVDVFTDTPFLGVPLPVFPNASGLSELQMQQIAGELCTSSTVFVFPGICDRSRDIRVFSPRNEEELTIHTAQAASFVLAESGAISSGEEYTQIQLNSKKQSVATYVSRSEGRPTNIQQSYETHGAIDHFTPTVKELAAMLSLNPADIGFDNFRPLIVSCGAPVLIVPIKSYTVIREAVFNLSNWSNSSAPSALAQEILLFSNNTDDNPADFHARLLGPTISFNEDPPIGGVLASFSNYICAHEHIQEGTHTFAVQRGANEQRRSLLHVEMDNRKTQDLTIRVGGSAVLMSESTLLRV